MSPPERALATEIDGLRRYARLLVRDPVAADDLVQECLLRAIEKWDRVARADDLRRYLFTVLHNLHVDDTRKRARTDNVIDFEAVATLAQPASQLTHIELADLRRGLAGLSENQRRVVLLVGFAGFTYEETAEITGTPVGTVMSRLSRGREALRTFLAGTTNDKGLRRAK